MADERLGASFSIDTTNLKTGLAQANRLIRESESEFKAAAAGMDDWTKSEAGLNAKIKSLSSVTEVQKAKVTALKSEYQNLIRGGLDPASREAVELRTKINNEEAALRSNEQEIKRQKEALKNLGDETEKTGNKYSKLGDIAKTAGKVAAAAAVAAAAGIVAITKQAISSYADYEQLVGGVDTLFGKASAEVQKKAANAYKTAGMSANEYMETVTGFSASLIQSLSGDTVKAAKYADMAITDMSDNANKMGTSIDSIQNAYSGFAKQNYTMLDNLKLGYGGTKEEMKRLLADATKLSGVKYDLSSYADIVDAIHVVQTEMGITGTTAKEASTTIQGSVSSMKSAWSNLLTGLADDTQDFDALITNLIDSIGTVAANLIPRIKIVLSGIVKLVSELVPQLAQMLPPMINELLPAVVEGITGIINAIITMLPDLIDAIMAVIPQLTTAVLNALPLLVTAVMQIVTNVIAALGTMLPQIVSAIIDVIPQIIDALIASIPQLLDAAIQLLSAIVDAIPTIITQLGKKLPSMIDTIINGLLDALPTLLDAAVTLLLALVDAIPIMINSLLPQIPKIVDTIINGLLTALPQLVQGAIQLFMGIIQAIPQIQAALLKNMPLIIRSIVSALIKGIPEIIKAGGDLLAGLFKGLLDPKQIAKSVKNLFDGIVGGLKNLFGIHSPSKVMENLIGKNLALGIGEGFKNNIKGVNDMMSDAVDIPDPNFPNNNGGRGGSRGGVVINQYNTYSQAHSRYELYKSKQQTAAAVRLAMGTV